MAGKVVGFRPETARRLLDKLNGRARAGMEGGARFPEGKIPAIYAYAATTDGSGITARSGTTPGTGTVILKKIDPITGLEVTVTKADGSDDTRTCKNRTQTAIPASTPINILSDVFGTFWVIVEDCG